jgi:S-formylglutathione hydrolase
MRRTPARSSAQKARMAGCRIDAMRLPIVCACGLGLLFAAFLPSQDRGGAAKGKQAKGNGLIQPLPDLEKSIKGKIELIKVHGQSLEGNLEGDSPDRDVFVYLPPSYATEPNRRYPVVYTLHGYGLHAQQWIGFANWGALERDVAAGTAKEMILVAPDAYTLQNGSFYSTSKATGDWETYVAVDLVNYIDSHYRTIPNRMSRGLMGHSMGGYGTWRIGMKHPEVFSSLFAMSAASALDTGTIAPDVAQALEAVKSKEEDAKVPYGQKGSLAKAAAWSADAEKPPLFLDLPVKDGKPVVTVQAKWAANSVLVMLEQYAPNLKKMKAIAMNVGDMDALMPTNQAIDEALTQDGITHTFEIFPGTHNDQVPMNFEQKVLPFFAKNLSFDTSSAQSGGSAKGTYARITVHGKSLEGNLEGDSPDRDVSVYLPPSYQTSGSRRYPVIYLLHGYTNSDIGWFGPEGRGSFVNGNTMTAAAERAYGSGVGEAILVMPNAYTIYQGSMFSDSVTTGDWLGFVAKDLVEYMDTHYRTIADRGGRGLAGHSMGGYGTFRVAAKYPQVFSSIYILSACCLGANLNPNPQSSSEAQAEALKTPAEAKGAARGLATLLAESAAWAPDPGNPPFYFDLPAKDGKIQPAVVAKWAANAPLAMVDQTIDSFKTLHIGHDVGDKDGLARSNEELERVFKGYGIQTQFEIYDGDHTNHIVDRMEKVVLPFFAKNLVESR